MKHHRIPPLFHGDRRKNQILAEHVRTTFPAQDHRSEIRVSRRTHPGWCRILFIPVGTLVSRFFRR